MKNVALKNTNLMFFNILHVRQYPSARLARFHEAIRPFF